MTQKIKSPAGFEFDYGERVCSFGNENIVGKILYWAIADGCWVVLLEKKNLPLVEWIESEPVKIKSNVR